MALAKNLPPLSRREEVILRAVVKSFIKLAGPIGSRFLSRQGELELSAATIRNTLSDLEDLGYLNHPYTSAGRVPTQMGYRVYVDRLMEVAELTASDKLLLNEQLRSAKDDTEKLLKDTARLMGKLTNLLAVALSPALSGGKLHRLEVVPLSSNRLMFVISVDGGLVKTIMIGVDTELDRTQINHVVRLLNERLSGLTLKHIRATLGERLKDLSAEDKSGVVQIVVREVDQLFSDTPDDGRVQLSGAHQIFRQPEFQGPGQAERIFSLLENEEVVVHLLERRERQAASRSGEISVTIGRENDDAIVEEYSIVSSSYKMGDSTGVIGLIGPTRMEYARAIALVNHVAAGLSGLHGTA